MGFDFGHIREMVQTQNTYHLPSALYWYEDSVPNDVVFNYVLESLGWCPPYRWEGSRGTHSSAMTAHRFQSKKRLEAIVYIGKEKFVIKRFDRPEQIIQDAVKEYRKVALDKQWTEFADAVRKDFSYVDEVTSLLYECLDNRSLSDRAASASWRLLIDVDNNFYPSSMRHKLFRKGRWAYRVATEKSAHQLGKYFGGWTQSHKNKIDKILLGAPL